MKSKMVCFLVAILVGVTSVGYTQVKDYPKNPIQIVLGHSAGGGIDIFYRLVAEGLARKWKVPVNILNKAQASGAVAADEVARADKDGYTMLGNLVGPLATLTIANPKSPINLLRDFEPIEMHSYAAQVLLVNADSKFKSYDELIDYARKKPGELLCAVSDIGSNLHLEMLLFQRSSNVKFTLVHHEGTQEIIAGLLGRHFDTGYVNDVVATPFVAAGKMRAIVSDIKSPLGCPTFAEKGYPQVNLPPIMALMGPKGLPPAIIKTWEDAIGEIVKDPNFAASMKKLNYTITMTVGREKLAKAIKEEFDKYARFTPEELGWKK